MGRVVRATLGLLAALAITRMPAFAQGFITTVAGSAAKPVPDQPAAKNAGLGRIRGLALDLNGNLLIADPDNAQVYRLSPMGVLSVVAGNGIHGSSGDDGPATEASLRGPVGVGVDSFGNVYIADEMDNRVRKVSPSGMITAFAGNGFSSSGGDGGLAKEAFMKGPDAIAVDRTGNVYIADRGNNQIRKVDRDGRITSLPGNFQGPTDLAFDQNGNLYVAESYLNTSGEGSARVRMMTTSGDLRTLKTGLSQTLRIAVASSGTVFISESPTHIVHKFDVSGISDFAGNGMAGFAGDGDSARKARLNEPDGVAVDASGSVYIADSQNERLRRVNQAGIIDTIAGNRQFQFGGDEGAATAALLNHPTGVKVDSDGNLYIADTLNNRIRKVSPSNVITTIAGTGERGYSGDGGVATKALLNQPAAVAVDKSGNVYIADTANHVIRKRDIDGTMTTFAGSGVTGALEDNVPAAQARLDSPRGLAVDAAGNLYIADGGPGRGNNTIRKVSGGIITTLAGNGAEGKSGDDVPARDSPLLWPAGIAVDSSGVVYFAEEGANRVRRISGGKLTTVAGSGTTEGSSGDGGLATAAQLNRPLGVALDSVGNLYIADTSNHVVRKVSAGNITTVAGNRINGFSGDGGQSTGASFRDPSDVAVDTSGNLYIADASNNRIREVLDVLYRVTPSSLGFSSEIGKIPDSETIILSGIAGLKFVAFPSATAPWLSVSPTEGSIPATLRVSADPSTLTVGTRMASIIISVPNAGPAPTTVPVTFTILPRTPAALEVSADSVTFTSNAGGAPISQLIRVANSGGGSLAFTASAPPTPWLAVSPGSGTIDPFSAAYITVTASPGLVMPGGTYTSAITIQGANRMVTIPVTLSVNKSSSTILLSQTALSFRAAPGGVPLPQQIGILNTGRGALDWTASAQTLSGGNWLQIDTVGGTVQQPFLDVSPVSVSVDAADLMPGDYYGQIQIAAAAANSPQFVTVLLTVVKTDFDVGPEVRPTGLIFAASAGAPSAAQDVLVGSPKAQSDGFLSGSIGRAFTYAPTNAILSRGQPVRLHVVASPGELPPGSIERGTITLQFNDGTPRTISVLNVAAPSNIASQTVRSRSACPSSDLLIQFRSPLQDSQSHFEASVGQPTPVEVQVVDRCGNVVGPGDPQGANVSASFSNGDTLPMVHIGNGVWTGTWRPSPSTSQGTVTIEVAAVQFSQDASPAAGHATLNGVLNAAGKTPVITARGVAQTASQVRGGPLAPGGLVTLYGLNLAEAVVQGDASPAFPTDVKGTQVLLGTSTLPILYLSPTQLNVQVPFNLPVGTEYQLRVKNNDKVSAPQTLPVARSQPGIFTVNSTGTGPALIYKADGVTLVQENTPACVGERLTIYATGLGTVNPSVPEGTSPPASPPSTTDITPVVTIDNREAVVSFSGLAPGRPGVYQIKVDVPEGSDVGDTEDVFVTVSVGGIDSPRVTMRRPGRRGGTTGAICGAP